MNETDTHAVAEAVLRAGEAPVAVLPEKKPVIPMDQTQPKSNCKHCHGRGYIGTDVKTKQKIKCRCLRRQNKSTKVQGTPVSTKSGW